MLSVHHATWLNSLDKNMTYNGPYQTAILKKAHTCLLGLETLHISRSSHTNQHSSTYSINFLCNHKSQYNWKREVACRHIHAAFHTAPMITEGAAEDGVKFVISFLLLRLCSRLPLAHVSVLQYEVYCHYYLYYYLQL